MRWEERGRQEDRILHYCYKSANSVFKKRKDWNIRIQQNEFNSGIGRISLFPTRQEGVLAGCRARGRAGGVPGSGTFSRRTEERRKKKEKRRKERLAKKYCSNEYEMLRSTSISNSLYTLHS
tara:strand:- start:2693 stop:3058 length:366 start_codon:yes stop_codon:yes gene_type:complete